MLDVLALWGLKTTWSAVQPILQPILQDIAEEVAKDTAKSFVGQCFQKVYSVIHREPLIKATGLALKELLELIENELLDTDLTDEQIKELIPNVKDFLIQPDFEEALGTLFLEPDYRLEPTLLAHAWQHADPQNGLPDDFSWSRIAKRFEREVAKIRLSSSELEATFDALATAQNHDALQELVGLPPDFDLETYREALVERYGNLNFDSLDTSGANYDGVRLWRVFVPQTVRESRSFVPQILEIPKEHQRRLVEADELDAQMLAEMEKAQQEKRQSYYNQPLRPVLEVCSDPSLSRMVILGDPGAGKSSLLRYLALEWAHIENATERYTQPLPLLIELREYNRWECHEGKDFTRYLHHAATWHRLNQQTLDHLLQKPGGVILLLDGLDEVFDPNQRELVIHDIHRFSNQYKATRMIVTSRIVGYKPQRLRNAEFRDFMLQDLEKSQINDFLDRWHQDTFTDAQDGVRKKERLQKAIGSSKAIAMLAGNPLLLTMMAILNRYQELPRDRAELYGSAAKVLLHQWDTERALEDYAELQGQVDLRAKREILRRVARAMQDSSSGLAGNIIHGDRLIDLIEDYLQQELGFQQARSAAQAVVKQLRERNFILCYLGADSYAFVHRTFLEYFCAVDFVQRFHVEKSMDEAELIDLFDQHCRADEWREVFRLICGQIDEQFVGKIVKHLATRTDVDQWDGKTALPEFPLAIWALSEVRNVARLEEAGRLLMEKTIAVATQANNDSNEFMLGDLAAACRDLGGKWPGYNQLRQVALSQVNSIISGYGEDFWPILVAYVLNDRDIIYQLAQTTNGLNSYSYRDTALSSLADKWADDRTREFLTQRAVDDEHHTPRRTALSSLADKWADDRTREFLTQRAVDDESEDPRSTALSSLADKWADDRTREFLTQRAVDDESEYPRRTALSSLADKWADDRTREFLTQRAVDDESEYPRRTALSSLADKWADDRTREFLTQRASEDGFATSFIAKEHSRFGEILFTHDLDGIDPYLDPKEGINQEHIEKAAQRSGIQPDQIEEMVRSLSEHLGWDIRLGSQAGSVSS